MIEFKEELLTNKELVVHCRTEEQAISFCTWMDSKGLQWRNDDGKLFTQWASNQQVYSAAENYVSSQETESNKTILSYEDALLKEETKHIPKEPKINIVNVGKYDLYEVLSFTQELLDKGFKVDLATNENMYTLEGYKDA